MIRRYTLNKFYVTTLSLAVVIMFMIFPVKEDNSIFETKLTIIDENNLESVFLLDNNNYLTLTQVYLEGNNLETTLKNKLNILIQNSDLKSKIPKHFYSVLPKNTKILDLTIKNDTVTVNFSKELLNTTKEAEEKMIESIVFTLTEEESIDKVIIKVEGSVLTKLPISGNTLPQYLTRDYGINKKYDITSITDITKTTIYYVNDIEDNIYFTPVTYISNDTRDKVSIIIDELSSSPVYQNTLKSYLNTNVELNNFEEIDNVMYLSFNEGIYDKNLNDNLLETVKYTISMSVLENYDVEDVVIKIN